MSDRTVPERINEFLVRCAGRAYCDHCIQERLGLRWRQQVQLVTATLGVTSGYRRSTADCCTCQDTKQVTSFIGSPRAARADATLSLPKSAVSSKAAEDDDQTAASDACVQAHLRTGTARRAEP